MRDENLNCFSSRTTWRNDNVLKRRTANCKRLAAKSTILLLLARKEGPLKPQLLTRIGQQTNDPAELCKASKIRLQTAMDNQHNLQLKCMTLDRRAPHNELSTSLTWWTTLYLHRIRVKAIFKMLERKCNVLQRNCREQWWLSGESICLPPMWPRFDSQTQCHMWVEFVEFLLCSERLSPGTPVFPFPQKPTFDRIWLMLISICSVPNQRTPNAKLTWHFLKIKVLSFLSFYVKKA